MKSSTRFNLPYVSLHQSLKELTINEMISEIDSLIASPVLKLISELPQSPEDGGIYLIRSSNQKDLEGKTNYIALWINNRWKFIEPRQYMTFYSIEHSKNIIFRDGDWNF